jgi:hypothetical protein
MAWYDDFAAFMRERRAGGEWLYRGQPVRFTSVVPSLMRSSNQWMHYNKLASFEPRVAKALSAGSPQYDFDRIYPGLSTSAGMSALPDATPMHGAGTITAAQFIRALAQHYDFPTFFIDVSFSPAVAAFFATHEARGGRYAETGDSGVVYRWPAVRTSDSRLVISGTDIEVLDLQRTAPSFLRPHQQKAGMAMPVRKPLNLFEPETLAGSATVSPFVTAISDFHAADMASLPSCQKFTLPRGAAAELRNRLGISQLALFPNSIDFGYSYFVMATFLSMAIHEPGYFGPNPEYGALLREMYERGIAAGRVILDREYFRLRGGTLEHRPTMSFRESVTALNDQADAARQAIQAMIAVAGNDPESQRARRLLAQRSYEVAAKRHREMKRQLRGNPSAVAGLPPKPSRSSFTSRLPDEGTEWAAAEFERRCSALTGMLQFADTLPLHLLTAERGAAHSAVPGLQSERAAEVLATLSEAARWQSRPA